jgi:translocation and assembly module TamB
MRNPRRIAWIAAGGLVLLLLVGIAGILTVQSPWFYNKVRKKIVSVTESATGGRVEIAKFTFDWHSLTATVTGFTLRGTEPVNDPPLLHADQVVVGLKIISVFRKDFDIALLRVDAPHAFLLIASDGSTNVPRPKPALDSKKPAMEKILDLAIRHFELNRGIAEIHATGRPVQVRSYNAKGDDLHALFTFDANVPRYHGDLSAARVFLAYGGYLPVIADFNATLAIEKNRVVLEQSKFRSGDSVLEVNGRLESFTLPVITAEYRGKVSLALAGAVLKLKSRQSGWLELNGSASYKSAQDYALSGLAKAYEVNYQAPGIALHNVRAQAKIDGGPKSISVDQIVLDALGGRFKGKAEITNFENFKLNGEAANFDIHQIASLATREKLPYDGLASGPVFVEGRISELKNNRFTATSRVNISPARAGIPVQGLLDVKYNGLRDTLDLGQSFIQLPNTRIDIQGTLGQTLNVRAASTNLDDLLPLIQAVNKPGTALPIILTPRGLVTFDGTVTGKIENPVIAGHAGGANFIVRGEKIDSVNADLTVQANQLTVSNGQLRQGVLAATFSGTAGLRDWNPENSLPLAATLSLQNAGLQDLLGLAGQNTLKASGTLNATARVTGTLASPQATADLSLLRGKLEGEPFDRLTAHLDAPNRGLQTLRAQMNAGAKQVNLTAGYVHADQDLLKGELTFKVTTNKLAMSDIVVLHQHEPDLYGDVLLTADGALEVERGANGQAAFRVTRINGESSASGIQVAAKHLGDLRLNATTISSGPKPQVEIKLRSNLADAVIAANGRWTLDGDYPGSMKVDFTQVHLDTVRRLLLTPQEVETFRAGGTVEGSLTISGPAAKPDQLKADLDIPKLLVEPLPPANGVPPPVDLSLRNSAPIRITMANNTVRVESAHLVAQDSDFTLAGDGTLWPKPQLNFTLNGRVNLAIVHAFNNDVISSGGVLVSASIRGPLSDPRLGGSMQLNNANIALADVPNGLSNANGTISFSGTQANITDLTGESGGGKVRLGGFASIAGGVVAFRLRADATGVRLRYPQGVSTMANAQLALVGTPDRSVLSGTVTVERLAFNPKTDLGSILSAAAAPPETPAGNAGFSRNLQLDVQIQTAPDITFQSNYTQSIEADANLRLRGSVANPVLLGRINITQGDLTFFGNKYTINQGSVSFFNPVKLEPILNIDLETVARGVDVTITVSGPISKLNVSYRSDPPLQFADIVGLLATGRTPNDATIAARQPNAPQQSWQQMGASALVGQTISNPVAGRLQRFFGVSNIKIDPVISDLTNGPGAKVTLEQQVTPEITFTYITDVSSAQQQVIRVEWAFSSHWSAVALRDENGEFGIDFLYKKRFK